MHCDRRSGLRAGAVPLDPTRDFLRRTMPSDVPRETSDTATGSDRERWRRRAELGRPDMLVPETLGGGSVSGRPLTELALVAEEFGRACAPGPPAPRMARCSCSCRQTRRA
ncbi:acyl-CoA dehydrogenase family protein [Nocardia vinacea]|uniref:acyl-CoA dehydrogenase family protein n=1 Tax=Nocardia vinacea TaxID=96468 RepID=UPI002E1008D0|nr:acyl-CoA dehydrogenase family protein [Nocardia vinacea]